MTSPRVSVITATYNWSSVLRYAIETVRWQTLTDFEMLVVGDGCTDDSGEVVASFRDPRVRWHNLEANSGHQSAANNAGLAMARGEFIAYLGHDDVWFPTHLEALVGALDQSRADVAYSWTELVFPAPSPMRIISGVNPSGEFEPDLGVPPSSLMHRRSLYEQLGGWKDYRTISEEPEVELLRRAFEAGKRFVPVRNLSVFKFNSAFRRNSYVQKPSHEQAAYVRRIREEPDFVVRELSSIVQTQISRHPEDVPRAHDWSASPPGTAVKKLRVLRGLEAPEPPAVAEAPFAPFHLPLDSPESDPCLLFGWGSAEAGFRWSDGTEAAMAFRLANLQPLQLQIQLTPFLGGGGIPRQAVGVSVNGHHLIEAAFATPQAAILEVQIPQGVLLSVNRLTLMLPNATSPAALGMSTDLRELGVAVHWIDLQVIATS